MGTKVPGIIVQKYGGSSVANVEMLKRVAKRIVDTRRKGYGVVVVISAMGNQTDELLDLARQVSTKPSSRELDMLLSVGERIAMAVLSMAINDLGQQAISFTGSQSGIITDSSHTRARIVEVRAQRIIDELGKGKIVIVAGYQGVSREREITTLGRGGSDTTAIALAAALPAERCEIYSDVDGVYTADPRVVDGAVKLDRLSYEEMEDLSRAGAVVMKADAIEYARRHDIVFSLMSSFREGSGTLVGVDRAPVDWPVLGLSYDRSVILLRGVEGSRAEEVRVSVVPRMKELGFAPLSVTWVADSGSDRSSLFMVFREDGIADPRVVAGFVESGFPWMKGCIRLCGSVTVITREVRAFGRVSDRAIGLLQDKGFDLLGYTAADRCCHFFLPVDEVMSAIRLLHEELITR